jgi:hypothetical protein
MKRPSFKCKSGPALLSKKRRHRQTPTLSLEFANGSTVAPRNVNQGLTFDSDRVGSAAHL